MRPETRAIHSGQDPEKLTGAVVVPIFQTSTYAQSAPGVHSGHEYSRTSNPTRDALQTCLASLENARYGLAFSSGMGAISTLMTLFSSGDHVVSSDDVYGGTFRVFEKVFRRVRAPLHVRRHERRGRGRARHRARDQARLDRIAHESAAQDHGHPRGRGDRAQALGSPRGRQHVHEPRASTSDRSRRRSRRPQHHEVRRGPQRRRRRVHRDESRRPLVPAEVLAERGRRRAGPFDSWLTLRGIKTLFVRMRAHETNARAIAELLSRHPGVTKVFYPGLPESPGPRDPEEAGIGLRRNHLVSSSRRTRACARRLQLDEALLPRGEPRGRRKPDRAPGHHDARVGPAGTSARLWASPMTSSASRWGSRTWTISWKICRAWRGLKGTARPESDRGLPALGA